jgi:hypothetical protein
MGVLTARLVQVEVGVETDLLVQLAHRVFLEDPLAIQDQLVQQVHKVLQEQQVIRV